MPLSEVTAYRVIYISESVVNMAKESAPLECCGCVTLRDRLVVHRFQNISLHPAHTFEIDPDEFYQIRAAYGVPAMFFHSHPVSPPDISHADMQWMDAVVQCGYTNRMIIVGLEPIVEVRCYEKWDHGYRVIWRYEEKL